jgi:glycosyltransferase involved in cell wall biosynthesis
LALKELLGNDLRAAALRIAFLIPDCGGGGAQPMIIRLANEFARRGYSVDLVVFSESGPNRSAVSDKVTVFDLEVSRELLAPLALRRYLRRVRPDVAISALFHMNIFVLVAKISLPFSRTRVIVTERNMLSVHAKHSKRRSRVVFKFLAWLLYRFASNVVGISEGVAADIKAITRLPDRKVSVIYNPAVTAANAKAAEATERRPENKTTEGPMIITVGRLEPQKDHETLLRAFGRLLKTQPAHLLILGDGSLREHLDDVTRRLGLQDWVRFAGYVENPYPLMKAADLFVLSSRYEGFGNVLVEAMLCGLPVVSTDCPSGPREILNGGDYGLLVPPGNPDALADAMEKTLAAPPCAGGQIAQAKKFSLKRSADAFEQLARAVHVPRRY